MSSKKANNVSVAGNSSSKNAVLPSASTNVVTPSAGKKQNEPGEDWCADCWKQAEDDCRRSHRLVDTLATIMRELQADLAAKSDAVQQVAKRLADVEKAVFESAPVLVAQVDEVDEDEEDLDGNNPAHVSISEVDLSITLAVIKPLTDEDKECIRDALEEAWIVFDIEGCPRILSDGPVVIDLSAALSGDILAKFVDHTPRPEASQGDHPDVPGGRRLPGAT